MTFFLCIALLSAASCKKVSIEVPVPDGAVKETFTYAIKGTDTLCLDVYRDTTWTTPHPTVLYSFGGGWRSGSRHSCIWAGRFVQQGYAVVSIDYRKTIKDKATLRDSLNFDTWYDTAMKTAIEDLFDATSYIVENAQKFCIDPSKIVASGGSAGAINSVTGEWMICNDDPMALEHLPKGFNYAGIISMAGAVWKHGIDLPEYAKQPCPHFFLHGIADDVVPYEMMNIPQCNYYGFGPKVLTGIYKENKWPYYNFAIEEADHYMCCGPDVKMLLPSEKADYTRAVFDFLEREVHEGIRTGIDYVEKDLDGPKTWNRLKKSYMKVFLSPKLRKQVCVLPETGSGIVEKDTYDFAVKDGDTLRLDIIRDPGFVGKRPVLLFSFGGGWEGGDRFFIENSTFPLADEMAKMGYVVVSYDYRLLYRKARKAGIVPDLSNATYLMQNPDVEDTVAVNMMVKSVEAAVEDLYDATSYVVARSEEFSIDPEKIVIMGGSAGAFNCLQAEYWLCNEMPIAKAHLPKGFRFAGLVPCAGGIVHRSDEPLVWKRTPAPILFYTGNVDTVVSPEDYVFKHAGVTFSGSMSIARGLEDTDASYILYTSRDRNHEMASIPSGYMDQFTASFIDRLVFNGEKVQANAVEQWYYPEDVPISFYMFNAKKYPRERLVEDYFKYIAHAWD